MSSRRTVALCMLFLALGATACGAHPRDPNAADLAASKARRSGGQPQLPRGAEPVSFLVMRLDNEEVSARMHPFAISAVVLSGRVGLRIGDRTGTLSPGETLEIPRFTPYAWRSLGTDSATLYVAVTPVLDDQMSLPGAESAKSPWRWVVSSQ